MLEQIRQFLRDNPRLPLVVGVAVLVGVLVVWGVWGGFSLDFSRFYAAEPTLCHWQSPDDRSKPECACAFGNNRTNLCHVCTGSWKEGNTDYSDAQWKAWDDANLCRPSCPPDAPYETDRDIQGGGRFPFPQYCVEKPADCPDGYYAFGSNPTVCAKSAPPATVVPVATTLPVVTAAPTATATAAPTVTVVPRPVETPNQSASCSQYYSDVAKCYGVHACGGHSDSVCGETFTTNDTPGDIGYGVYYGFEDVYKAPDGSVYWFNWRSKNPPENDPTKWTWAKIPSNPQAWCASPAQGVVSVQAPTTNLHAIFDAQAQAGRFGCAVAKVGVYNNSKNPDGIDCPVAEKKYYACRAALNDRDTTPAPTPAPTPIQTASPPTPFPEPPVSDGVTCAPNTQTVVLGQTGSFQAFGGNGVYQWDGGPGAVQEEGAGDPGSAAFSWTAAGLKAVTVSSGGGTGTCTVVVQDPSSTPLAAPIALAKSVRNETAGQTAFRASLDIRTNQRIQFMLRITDRKGTGSGAIRIRDTLPPGMTYMPGRTTVDGSPVGDGIVSDGLNIPQLTPRGEHVVLWFAVADRLGQLRVGPQLARPEALLQATDNGQPVIVTAAVTVTLFGTATGTSQTPGGPGAVPTGPGGATLLSLVLAAVGSLLYAAHTRSAGFRRGEVQRLGRDQGPMDFRA